MKEIRKTKIWTPEETELLKEIYPIEGHVRLCRLLNRTMFSVIRKASQLNLKTIKYTESRKNQLNKLHTLTRERAKDSLKQSNPTTYKKRQTELSRIRGKEIRTYRRKNNLCIACGQPRIEHSKRFCLLHWAKMMGTNCGKYSSKFGKLLLDVLVKQNYKCAITGETLIPSLNASVDHIIPKSKGGSKTDINNIQWVTTQANYAKSDKSLEELIEFCKKVLIHNKISI